MPSCAMFDHTAAICGLLLEPLLQAVETSATQRDPAGTDLGTGSDGRHREGWGGEGGDCRPMRAALWPLVGWRGYSGVKPTQGTSAAAERRRQSNGGQQGWSIVPH